MSNYRVQIITPSMPAHCRVCPQPVNKSYALGYLDDLITPTHLRCLFPRTYVKFCTWQSGLYMYVY